jgi:hypothetical protein
LIRDTSVVSIGAEAVHDGYAPIEHRRSIVRADGAGWLIVDELRGPQQDSHCGRGALAFRPIVDGACRWQQAASRRASRRR